LFYGELIIENTDPSVELTTGNERIMTPLFAQMTWFYTLVVELGNIGLLVPHFCTTGSTSLEFCSIYNTVDEIPLDNRFIRVSIHGYNQSLINL
jgi:hypothetical protein